jgi:hypothetical protein
LEEFYKAPNDFPPSEDEIGNSPASSMVLKRRAWGWRRGDSVVLKHQRKTTYPPSTTS